MTTAKQRAVLEGRGFTYDETFTQRFARRRGKGPIVFFHTWRPDDETLVEQGCIDLLHRDGSGTGQFASFLTGWLTERFTFTREWLKRCTFYLTDADMNRAYRLYDHRDEAAWNKQEHNRV